MIILYNTTTIHAVAIVAADKLGGREREEISVQPNGFYYYYYSIVLDQCLLALCDAVSRDFIYPHTHTHTLA